jgi:hypothetical protein
MDKLKKITKQICSLILLISAIVTIIDFFIKYWSNMKLVVTLLKVFDLYLIGQVLQILGFMLVIASPFILIVNNWIFHKPKQNLVDLVIPFLLPQEEWIDSKMRYNKKLRVYFTIKIGLIIIICGLSFMVAIKLFSY